MVLLGGSEIETSNQKISMKTSRDHNPARLVMGMIVGNGPARVIGILGVIGLLSPSVVNLSLREVETSSQEE
jgi:hypothetical protein